MNEPTDRQNEFSAEHLNAFVDEQLAAEEKSRLLLALNSNEALSREVCELRKVRDLVRLAYPEPATAGQHHGRSTALNLSAMAATVAVLSVGMVLGWFLHTRIANSEIAAAEPVTSATPIHLASTISSGSPSRIILHVSDSNPNRLTEVLNDIDGLLRYYKTMKQNVRVEVVTNGEGLALLRTDISPHVRRIARLQEQHDNLVFIACQNTIDRLAREKGITARLLPGVVIIDSGVAQLMRRQNQGWAYIQA